MAKSSRRKRARPAARAGIRAGTFEEWLRFFGVDLSHTYWKEPFWPPDVYAVTAAFLRRTGKYVEFVNSLHGQRPRSHPRAEKFGNDWRATLSRELGKYWHGDTGVRLPLPKDVRGWWKTFSGFPGTFEQAAEDLDMTEAAWNLCIAADVASRGIGVRWYKLGKDGKQTKDYDFFLATAFGALMRNDRLSFCMNVPKDRVGVQAKQHTPQRGCTIRSLTHHLAYYLPSEIKAYWDPLPSEVKRAREEQATESETLETLNLLLLPWPTKVNSQDFHMTPRRDEPTAFGYFDYGPGSGPAADLRARVGRALDVATHHAQRIHGIVFPELSLTRREFDILERFAVQKRAALIAGVRDRKADLPANTCAIQPYGLTRPKSRNARGQPHLDFRRTQYKHHRWCLDRDQVLQYGLGGRVTATSTRAHWERIYLGPREIYFVALRPWLTTCVLICEDLARQEPMGEVVRAVGPNLVFALLMDGPQLRHRWPSRYAAVLAEDPGCSVLTLTSLGMASRSRTMEANAPDRSNTIGLWRDAKYGERELTLDKGDDACVLSLVCHSEQEYTLDGRHDQGQAHFPVFAGFRSFSSRPVGRA